MSTVRRASKHGQILEYVHADPGVTVADLALNLGILPKTATKTVCRLQDKGLLKTGGRVRGGVGRPPRRLHCTNVGALMVETWREA